MTYLAVTHVPTPDIELTPEQYAAEEFRAWVTLSAMLLGLLIAIFVCRDRDPR